jgi:hypothetical protein
MKTVAIMFCAFVLLLLIPRSGFAQWVKCAPVPGDNNIGTGAQLSYLAANGTRLFVPRPGGLDSIFYSDDNGGSWNVGRVPPWVVGGTNHYPTITGVWVNRGVILASGSPLQGNVFWRSTDNGVSWGASSTGITSSGIDPTAKVLAASGTTVYIGTGGSGVFLSTDNGTTWSAANNGLPTYKISTFTAYVNINCLAIIGNDVFAGLHGDLSGNRFGIRHCTLGGTTWDSLGGGLPSNVTVVSLLVVGTTLYARMGLTTPGNFVYKSTDLGATWTNSTNGLPDGSTVSLGTQAMFADGGTIFIRGGTGEYVSTTGGGNWTPMNSTGLPSSFVITGYIVVGNTMFIAVLDLTTLPVTTSIWKRAISELTAVGGVAPDLPAKFVLEQNYPNPFNPSTKIAYVIPTGAGFQATGSNVRLAIYDLLGRELAVLANGAQSPGRHEVTFDARGLASGVYLIRMTSGALSLTKRMALVR